MKCIRPSSVIEVPVNGGYSENAPLQLVTARGDVAATAQSVLTASGPILVAAHEAVLHERAVLGASDLYGSARFRA